MPAAIPVPVQTDLRSELQATLGDGFRVTRELAGGGMSRVFVAEEALLQREVVVKLLPPDLMAGLSVERFRAEIQYAARLQHPHVVPVLSAGVIEYTGGTRGPYYTMPYIRGETLRTRLSGTAPSPRTRRASEMEPTLRRARQVEALAAKPTRSTPTCCRHRSSPSTTPGSETPWSR